ncbi:MAG: MraY family glycosyltransferase [Campylobacterota bacterium]|nr:MraY family glycosyltransferase [Campylobacterota bacterium]
MLYINLLIVLLASFTITFLLIKYKIKTKLQAYPNHRSIHQEVMPNSGGIAIFISFIMGILLLHVDVGFAVIFCMTIVFLFGIYDDIFDARMRWKISILFLVGNILFFNGYSMEYLGTYLGYSIVLSSVEAYIFLIFVVISFVNSMNLIDGLDGLVSVVGIIILGSFLYLGLKFNDPFLTYVPAIYIASIIGYLYFNWSPAKIFMGDNGSLPLGLIIAIVAIHAVNMHYVTPVTILMLAALPILDTFVVMTKRISSGVSPFRADRSHIHHIILRQQKNNTKRTVLILGLVQLLLSYIGLGFKIREDILIFGLFFMLYVLFYFLLTPKK